MTPPKNCPVCGREWKTYLAPCSNCGKTFRAGSWPKRLIILATVPLIITPGSCIAEYEKHNPAKTMPEASATGQMIVGVFPIAISALIVGIVGYIAAERLNLYKLEADRDPQNEPPPFAFQTHQAMTNLLTATILAVLGSLFLAAASFILYAPRPLENTPVAYLVAAALWLIAYLKR